MSTFTIQDETGALSILLSKNGFGKAATWRKYPKYHIEVCPTEGDLTTDFCLDSDEIYKVSAAPPHVFTSVISLYYTNIYSSYPGMEMSYQN